MKRLLHIAALLLVMGPCLGSCSDDTCYDNVSSLPLATFYLGEKQQQVSGLTIMGLDVPGDSLLASSSTLNEIYLPLRASVGSTAFTISRQVENGSYSAVLHDTVTFSYDAVPFFHSIECGAMYNFNIKRVEYTCNGIDSVVMMTTTVTNSKSPALRIYFSDFQL
jgi:hypothetical protein